MPFTRSPQSRSNTAHSPWTLEAPQVGLLKLAKELGIAVIAYSPIGRGMLTGVIRSPAE